MNDEQKLHAFARQICMDRWSHWSSVYSPIAASGSDQKGYKYTDEAYRIFPRYNIDSAVLDKIEELDPDRLPDFKCLRQYLINSAQTATSSFARIIENRIHDQSIDDERCWLADRFETVTVSELAHQGRLFYRRVLSELETSRLRQRLKKEWEVDGYWYPLGPKTHASLVAVDVLSQIDDTELQGKIRSFFRANRMDRIFEIREWGPSYEVEAGAAGIFYNGAEGFWIDTMGDWIVYCSHESTMTFGGRIVKFVGGDDTPRKRD